MSRGFRQFRSTRGRELERGGWRGFRVRLEEFFLEERLGRCRVVVFFRGREEWG